MAFGNREVVKNLGYNIVWRWQDSYLWESPLATGHVPAYQTIDAQVTYRVRICYFEIRGIEYSQQPLLPVCGWSNNRWSVLPGHHG